MRYLKTTLGILVGSFMIALFAAEAAPETVYGKGLSGTEVVTIADLLKDPDAYVGKSIRIAGKITDVCPMAGCWVTIADDERTPPMRFKVTDGEIVFPMDTKGRPITAEGVFTRIERTPKQARAWAEHLAEERGEKFDPDTADLSTVTYQITGVGAVVR